MTTAIKAIYEDGVLKLKGPLQLEEHSEVEVLVLQPIARDPDDPTGWKAIDSLIGSATGAPPDVSERHDEYLYAEVFGQVHHATVDEEHAALRGTRTRTTASSTA